MAEGTRAFMNDDVVYSRSKSTMSDFKSVMTPATQCSSKSGISFAKKAGRNTSMGDYNGGIAGVNT